MKIYNTLSRKLEEFEPIVEGKVNLYTCGPTVYNYAHIGNYRAYIFEDLLRRFLKYSGYSVLQVMNLTDVDDKTIRGAREAGLPLTEYTAKYKKAFFDDLDILSIERAEHYPAATDHIPEMIELIGKLVENGFAYQSEDGSVYFSIDKFENYGQLARINREGMRSGARVTQDEYDKDNAADFAVWKAWVEEDGDVVWDSPWGRGRPGWHIECSAMSMKYLGESFDIHTGGVDNMFPHHEDEIAQSEGATGKKFVRYWMHNAHLVVEGQKMSKSLGNFFTLRDIAEKGYSGREIRYVLASAHYRQTVNFTFSALDAARTALARIDEFTDRVARTDAKGEEGKVPEWVARAESRFGEALGNDLGISEALASIFDMVSEGNRAMDSGEHGGDIREALKLLTRFDVALGFLHPEAATEDDGEVQKLVELREKARAGKDWAESDRLRDEIDAAGWTVRDAAEGPVLKKK